MRAFWTVEQSGVRRALAFVAAVALLLAVAGGVWLRRELQASLPTLDGAVRLSGLSAAVSITRDSLGIPTIRGTSREDVARATGFLHAQDRFFQMDLTRRRAAGELAELVGLRALPLDREMRIHRFRAEALQATSLLTPRDRAVLDAYTAGVNAGLSRPRRTSFRVPRPAADAAAVARGRHFPRGPVDVRDATGHRGRLRVHSRNHARCAAGAHVRLSGAARHRVGRADDRTGLRHAFRSRSRNLRPTSSTGWKATDRPAAALAGRSAHRCSSGLLRVWMGVGHQQPSRGRWQQQLGGVGKTHRRRPAAPRQRHAPFRSGSEHLVSRCTPLAGSVTGVRRTSADRRDPSWRAGGGRRQQHSCRVGFHEHLRGLERHRPARKRSSQRKSISHARRVARLRST